MEIQSSTTTAFRYSKNPFSLGFTLIEIMLVVVIIAIATTIAIPKFSGTFSSTRMKDAVRSTIQTARYARSMSILRQADCTLSFPTNRIQLKCGEDILVNRELPSNVEILKFENLADEKSSEKTVLYYANGMNDGFELTLSDDKDREETIICHPITGKVTLDD